MEPNQNLEPNLFSESDSAIQKEVNPDPNLTNNLNIFKSMEYSSDNTYIMGIMPKNEECSKKRKRIFSENRFTPNLKKSRIINIQSIPNYGNTCYVNCFLQFIFHSNFINLIIKHNGDNAMLNSIKNIYNNYIKEKIPNKIEIQQLITKLGYKFSKQQDVYDIFSIMFNILDKEINKDEYKIIYTINTKCTNCPLNFSKEHTLNILNIPNIININQLDTYFNTSQILFKCSKCTQETNHTQEYSNINLPNNLIIHIMKDNNSQTQEYPIILKLINETYKLTNSICRISIDNKSGHFYNILNINAKSSIKVSDDIISENTDYFDPNTIYLHYVKDINYSDEKTIIEKNIIFYDRNIKRMECPFCSKPVSSKYINIHAQKVHKIEKFSLKNYEKIEKRLEIQKKELPKTECPKCGKSYSVRHILSHVSKCPNMTDTIKSESNSNNPKDRDIEEEKNRNDKIQQKTTNKENQYQIKINSQNNSLNNSLEIEEPETEFTQLTINNTQSTINKDINNSEQTINETDSDSIEKQNKLNTNSTLKKSRIEDQIQLDSNNSMNVENTDNKNNIQFNNSSKDEYHDTSYNSNINNRRVNCDVCQKVICSKGLRNHYLRYHSYKLKECQFKCNINNCEMSFNTKNSLNHHQRHCHINEYLDLKLKVIRNTKPTEININKGLIKKHNNYLKPIQNKNRMKYYTHNLNNNIENLTKLNKEEFETGKIKKIYKMKHCNPFVTKCKLIIPNSKIQDKVYNKVSNELLSKYGKIIGDLPTYKTGIVNYKYKNKNDLENIYNNLIKDFIMLTKKFSMKLDKIWNNGKLKKDKEKRDGIKETIGLINSNNLTRAIENIRHNMRSSDRIFIYKELEKHNLKIYNIRNGNKEILLNILKEITQYNNEKEILKKDNIKYEFKSDYEFKNYINNNILHKEQRTCKINSNTIYKEFKNNFNSEKSDSISNQIQTPYWWENIEQTLPDKDEINLNDEIEYKYMSLLELNNILKSMNSSSAPGPDGITYGMIKNCYGFKILLNKILNTFIYYNLIPESFNISITKLLDKNKANSNEINNWRPICLQNTISKLLSKWFANKIYSINNILKTKNKEIYSEEQKGFKPSEYGCEDHNFIIRSIYDDMKRNTATETSELTTLMIDFSDAFTNVKHSLIHKMLNIFKIPEVMKNMIIQSYKKAYTKIKINKEEYTKNIYINKGVRQGDPLSPLLFNMCLEPLIRLIKQSKIGYRFKNNNELLVNVLAYADDILITTNSINEMETLFKIIEEYCNWSGININVNKCGSASTFQLPNGEIGQKLTNFIINNQKIPDIGYTGQLKYLGNYVSNKFRTIINDTDNILFEIKENIKSLNNSILSGIDKIKGLKQYILPRLEFILRNSYVDIKELERLDTFIAINVKSWLQLPNTLSNDILYLKWFDGGIGIPNICERYRISKLVSFIKLYNGNNYISKISEYELNQYERNRNIEKGNSDYKFLDWKVNNNGIKSKPNRTQYTSNITKIYQTCFKYDIQLEYKIENNNKRILIRKPNYINNKCTNNYDILNQIMRYNRINTFDKKKFQSYKTKIMTNNRTDNRIMKRIHKLNDNLLKNIIQARTNTFPTKYSYNIWNKGTSLNINCSLNGCLNKTHNISHILQGCVSKRYIYRNRHNNVSNIICKQLRRQKQYEIYGDKTQNEITELNGDKKLMNQRPDILLINRNKMNIIILEIAFINFINSYPEMENQITEYKSEKYKNLIDFYKSNGYTISFHPIIFDSTGFIFNKTKETLTELFKFLKIKVSMNRICDDIIEDILWNLSRILNLERKLMKIKN